MSVSGVFEQEIRVANSVWVCARSLHAVHWNASFVLLSQ